MKNPAVASFVVTIVLNIAIVPFVELIVVNFVEKIVSIVIILL